MTRHSFNCLVALVVFLALVVGSAFIKSPLCGQAAARIVRACPRAALPAREDAAESLAVPASTAQARSQHALFDQIERDFEPFSSGITAEMVDQSYCQGTTSGFRVQVVNGSVYIVGEKSSWQSRHFNIKRQILWLASLQPDGGLPNGLDFMIEQEDFPPVQPVADAGCPERGPVLVPAKAFNDSRHAHAILSPDHTFGGWPETHTLQWDEMLALQQSAAAQHPWAHRQQQMFFRGNGGTGQRRHTDPQLSKTFPDLLDIEMSDWPSNEAAHFVALTEHCSRKLLLHVPGNSYAARLKYLLACGSAVVIADNGFIEFWYHLLRDKHNCYVTKAVDEANRGHHLLDAAKALQEDDAAAQKMGKAGAALAAQALAPEMISEYWRRLLHKWYSLQTFNASTVHPDAVPLELSILTSPFTKRTCPASCPASA